MQPWPGRFTTEFDRSLKQLHRFKLGYLVMTPKIDQHMGERDHRVHIALVDGFSQPVSRVVGVRAAAAQPGRPHRA